MQIISRNEQYTQFFFQIADRGCELGDSDLRDAARNILRIIPPDQNTMENLYVSTKFTTAKPFMWEIISSLMFAFLDFIL